MNIVICSCEKSGASLLGGILNCHPNLSVHLDSYISKLSVPENTICYMGATFNVYKEYGVNLLNLLHKNNDSNTTFIWLVRNPIACISCLFTDKSIPSIEGLDYWISINTILWYFLQSIRPEKQYLLKFEQMIMNKNVFADLFDSLDLEFNEQYLDYEDFDQPAIHNNPTNKRGIDIEKIDPYPRENIANIDDAWKIYRKSEIIMAMGYSQAFLV